MTSADHKRTGWVGRRGATKVKKLVGAAICVVVAIFAAIAVAIAQPWATGAVHPTQSIPYLGVHEPDTPGSYSGINQFAEAIGTQPNIVSYYSPWKMSFQARFAASAAEHGALTLVQMDPTNISLSNIIAGRYDTYLRSYAAAVRKFGARVVLSFGHEMNGDWYSWGYRHTSPTVFVATWRHIVSVFRAAGAKNVTWLWTVNVINKDLPISIPNPSPWWPGASYVNWVGIDGYYYEPSSSFTQLFGPTIVAVRELTDDPILIAETGAAATAGQPTKINDLFDGIRAYGLLGFVWFDENVQGRAWRISNPRAFAVFQSNARKYLRSPITHLKDHNSPRTNFALTVSQAT
jgi:mannan endo-1,4-beta-mannosidase